MPAWPGGPCPECGEVMPANLVRCVTCRALLNHELVVPEVVTPEFVPLPEVAVVVESSIIGFFVECPHCKQELRINAKYNGNYVACKFCKGQFEFRLKPPRVRCLAFYANCPHCSKELRAAEKYKGVNVACKFCNGGLRFV